MSVLEGSVQNWQQKQGDDGVDDSFEEKTWGRCEAGTEAVIEQDAKDGVTNGHPKGSKKKGSGGAQETYGTAVKFPGKPGHDEFD